MDLTRNLLQHCVPTFLHALPGMKSGGQALVGGLDITVSRNFFGAQVGHGAKVIMLRPCAEIRDSE